MKRLIPIVVFLFAVAVAIPQQYMPNKRKAFQPVAAQVTFYPTNITGKSYTFWTAEGYTTNSGRAIITEKMGGVLTADAAAAAAPWRIDNALNGYPGLGFSSSGSGTPLSGAGYKTASTAHEIMMLCAYTNNGANGYVFSGTNATYYHGLRMVDTVPRIDVWVGSVQRDFTGGFPVSSFCVFSALFLEGTNAVYTNNVIFGSLTYGNGTVYCDGFRLGAAVNSTLPAPMTFIAIATFTNMLSATERTDCYNAFKTRYGL